MRPHLVSTYSGPFMRSGLGAQADPNCAAGMPYDVNGNLCSGIDPNCAQLMPYDVNGNPCPGPSSAAPPQQTSPPLPAPSGVQVDPMLLISGIAVGAIALFFLGGRVEPQRKFRGRRASRLEKEISERKRKLKELRA
jgi:hypothetical protein